MFARSSSAVQILHRERLEHGVQRTVTFNLPGHLAHSWKIGPNLLQRYQQCQQCLLRRILHRLLFCFCIKECSIDAAGQRPSTCPAVAAVASSQLNKAHCLQNIRGHNLWERNHFSEMASFWICHVFKKATLAKTIIQYTYLSLRVVIKSTLPI